MWLLGTSEKASASAVTPRPKTVSMSTARRRTLSLTNASLVIRDLTAQCAPQYEAGERKSNRD